MLNALRQYSNKWVAMVSVGFVAAACHGSPAPAQQHPLPPSAESELPPPPSAESEPLLRRPSCVASSTAAPDALPPVDIVPSAARHDDPRLHERDVVFHVTNDTGADVFIDETQPLVLELRGKLVDIDPGCGSYCPYCACKSCPPRPRQVRRIPDRETWDYGWNRRIYVAQSCGGACRCIREVNAQPGTYTVSLTGKRGASAAPTGSPFVYEGRPDEHGADCVAKATFRLKPSVHVDLKVTCVNAGVQPVGSLAGWQSAFDSRVIVQDRQE
jgi:hypothetical protein